jgi:A/G-specific adenine glycosylase
MTLAVRREGRKKDAPKIPANLAESAAVEPHALLAWYDKHRRQLPWRAKPGERADPYRVWLSEIMLQQTTVKTVGPYYVRFVERWPTVTALAQAPLEDVLKAWAGLGYYARARNLHACAQEVVRSGAQFPSDEAALRALPGVGAYTAAAVRAIAYDQPAVAIDGNVERVVARLFAVTQEMPAAKPRIAAHAASLMPASRFGDFTQALMDLGATICTPKRPACAVCPWREPCAARRSGDAETFPRKAPRREGNLRAGAAFVALRADGYVLLRRRPAKGLLGGMSEVPVSDWAPGFDQKDAPAAAPSFKTKPRWQRRAGLVRHVFTHFPLELTVYLASLPAGTAAPRDTRWVGLGHLAGEALPSVMRKVIAHALDHRRDSV